MDDDGKLTESSVFFLSVLHSGDSGIANLSLRDKFAVTFPSSAIKASSTVRHGSLQRFRTSSAAEYLVNTCCTNTGGNSERKWCLSADVR